MDIEINVVLHGAWTIGFVVENGKDRTDEYLNKLIRANKKEEHQRVMHRLIRFSEQGPPPGIEKFRHEGNGVYAIKEGQERIYGFFSGKQFFACAAGATKKSQKPDQGLLATVKRIKKEYEIHRSHHLR